MLEAYQRDDLTAAERHRVERHALTCPLCSAALAGLAARPAPAAETQADLSAVRRRLRPHLPRPGWRRSAGRVAAAVVGLLVLGWVVWYYAVAQRPYRLYLAAFDRQPVQAYQALRSLQPRTDTLDPRLLRGLQALRAEDDLAALAAFRAYLADYPAPSDGRPLLYTGMLALSTGYLAEARSRLEQLQRDYPALREDANWYLALTCLRERKTRQAIPLLEALVAPTAPGEYRREAAELLRQIR
jgi:hypothetical protein